MKIGIVVAAANLPDEAARFREWTRWSYPNAHLEIITSGAQGMEYNKAKALNQGIRNAIAAGCEVIVQTDVDYIIPPGILPWSAEHAAQGKWVWCLRRDVDLAEARCLQWQRWLKLPVHGVGPGLPYGQCWGSWNALSAENWIWVGGFDERCVGWGGEDDVLHYRLARLGIPRVISREWPLMHIAHPPRDQYCREMGTGDINKAWEKSPQLNYLDRVVIPKPTGPGQVWATLLTVPGREKLLAKTRISARDIGNIRFHEIVSHGDAPHANRTVTGAFPEIRKDWIAGIPDECPWTLLWEDDWETLSEINLDSWMAVLASIPEAGCVTFPHWPGDPVERADPAVCVETGTDFDGFPYRRHVYNGGTPIGPKGWEMAFDNHWPPFSFNPGLHPTKLLKYMVAKHGGHERTLAEAYHAAGYTMLHPVIGQVRHTGIESAKTPGLTWKEIN